MGASEARAGGRGDDERQNGERAGLRRREALRLATVGAVAAGLPGGASAAAAEAERPSDPRRLTYRETEHIRRYYARARV